jgi:hypothetical protein
MLHYWPSDRRQRLWIYRGAIALVILLLIMIVVGYVYDKTLWDWLKLLIVPATIAIGAAAVNWRQSKLQRRSDKEQAELQRTSDKAQADSQMGVEIERAQDDALRAYLDKMEQLLGEYRELIDLFNRFASYFSGGESDQHEKESDQQQALYDYQEALREYDLKYSEFQRMLPKYRQWQKNPNPRPPDWEGHWLNPEYAVRLEEEALSQLNMLRSKVELKRKKAAAKEGSEPVEQVDQKEQLLRDKATLIRAQTLTVLDRVNKQRRKRAIMRFLLETKLIDSRNPNRISLQDADFSAAYLTRMDLSYSDLNGALLTKVKLSGSRLFKAYLHDADLSKAEGITTEELAGQASSLELATMPNGQRYEDWLKSKDRGGDKEKSGPP